MRRARSLLLISLCLLAPAVSSAARVSPLEGQPAVRHRHELRKGRFEVGPSFAVTMNRFVRHAVLFGIKPEYHINDYFSIGADVLVFGVGADTSITGEVEKQFDKQPQLWQKLRNRFADIKFAADVRFAFTPFAGKVALFSKLFWAYDMYIYAGVAVVQTKNSGDNNSDFFEGQPDADNDVNAANEGWRPGMSFGLGVHFYFTNWFSMGLELKNLAFADNESGGDFTRGLVGAEKDGGGKILVNGDDKKFVNHVMFGWNFTFFFPVRVVQSR
jgi:outer membrane beta-barrel protein